MSRFTSILGMILVVGLPRASAQAPAGGEHPTLRRGAKATRKAPSALVDELRQSYKGAALLVQQKGIMGLPITELAVAVSNFEDGALRQPRWGDRVFNAQKATWFQPGDRVIAEKFDVDTKHDRITFTLVTPDRTCKAGLHFKFAKGFLTTADAGQVYDTIGQVILFEGGSDASQNQSQQPPPQQAAPPPQPQAPQPQAPQPSAPTDGAAVAPLILDGQAVGFGPAGAVLLPPDPPPPPSADGRPWVPVVRNGKTVAYAPPGSTIFPQASSSAAPATPPPAGPEPRTIRLGMTSEEVQAILGAPDKLANLESKVIFVYKDLKVTFTDGKVTDVQ